MKYFGFIKNIYLLDILLLIIILSLHLSTLFMDLSRDAMLFIEGLRLILFAIFILLYCLQGVSEKNNNNRLLNSNITVVLFIIIIILFIIIKIPIVNIINNYFVYPAVLIYLLLISSRGFLYNFNLFNALEDIKNKNYKDAIKKITEILIKYPDCQICFEYRGYSYYYSGDYSRAIEDFNKIINNEKVSVQIYKCIGISYKEIGINDNAKKYLHKYMNLISDDSEEYEKVKKISEEF